MCGDRKNIECRESRLLCESEIELKKFSCQFALRTLTMTEEENIVKRCTSAGVDMVCVLRAADRDSFPICVRSVWDK